MSNLPCKSDVEKWNVEQVAAYIQQMQVGDCRQAFLKRGIDGRSFLSLKESSLVSWSTDLPIKCRGKIAKLVQDINNQPAVPPKPRHVAGMGGSATPPNFGRRPLLQSQVPSTGISRCASDDVDDFTDSEDEFAVQRNPGPPSLSSHPPPRPVPPPPTTSSSLTLGPPLKGMEEDGYLIPNTSRAGKQEPSATAALDQAELNVYEPVEEAMGQRDGAPFPPGENGPPLPPRNIIHGSGEARGTSLPPTKVFPSSASKPTAPVPTSGSPMSPKAPVTPFSKEPQLPPVPSRQVPAPARPLGHSSVPSKSSAKTPVTNPGGKSSNVGLHPANESLSVILRGHQSLGTRGNESLPSSSIPSKSINPASLRLPPSASKKPALVLPSRSSDLSAPKSTTSTVPMSTTSASNILRRPASSGGMQPLALPNPTETLDTTDETEDPEDSQESVRLSDGSRVDLTPLYKSLVQRDFFHLVSRKRAEEMLLENPSDGMFVVRPSSTEHPLTLVVVCRGACSNIFIRQRPDRLFALGAEKHNEVVFKSVDELIEHHLQKPLKLNSGQEVLLTTSPGHHSSHVYVRMPIARLANSIAA